MNENANPSALNRTPAKGTPAKGVQTPKSSRKGSFANVSSRLFVSTPTSERKLKDNLKRKRSLHENQEQEARKRKELLSQREEDATRTKNAAIDEAKERLESAKELADSAKQQAKADQAKEAAAKRAEREAEHKLKANQAKVEKEATTEKLNATKEFVEVTQSAKKKAASDRRASMHFRRTEFSAQKKLGEVEQGRSKQAEEEEAAVQLQEREDVQGHEARMQRSRREYVLLSSCAARLLFSSHTRARTHTALFGPAAV